MTRKISPREWEALSAYLDGELNTCQRDRFERSLKGDVDLQSALVDLRRTHQALRSQPRLRVPRNFTLTPQMAGVHRTIRPVSSPYPTLRLASVLATVFFVIILTGDLLTRSLQPAMVQQTTAPLQTAPQGVGGGGGGIGAGPQDNTQVFTEVVTEAMAEVSVAMVPPIPTQLSPTEGGEVTMKAAPGQALEVTPLTPPTAEILGPTESPAIAQPMLGAQDISQQEEASEPESQAETPTKQRQGGRTFLLVIQVLLALLAFGAGLAAFLVRRSGLG
jgi:hypothetical protein